MKKEMNSSVQNKLKILADAAHPVETVVVILATELEMPLPPEYVTVLQMMADVLAF